jgi:hypothetical protein
MIRVETIAHYLEKHSADMVAKKKAVAAQQIARFFQVCVKGWWAVQGLNL